jgi:hypothetical protein
VGRIQVITRGAIDLSIDRDAPAACRPTSSAVARSSRGAGSIVAGRWEARPKLRNRSEMFMIYSPLEAIF